MESVLYNISQVLGITIIHSLWQGLLIYFLLRIIFASTPNLSSAKKYNLAVAATAAIFLCFVYTLLAEVSAYNWVNLTPANALLLLPFLKLSINGNTLNAPSVYTTIAAYMPYVSAIYIAGLVVNVAKLSSQWNRIRQIKQSVIAAEQMQQFINKFCKKLDITKQIGIKFSEVINVPCMMGYFKPLIILPVSMATYLSACEIEAILLHELSHIKRNDYLVNMVQQAITVILFFNPFAQLVSRLINVERENGCDDLVIAKTGKPLIYAKALLKLEESRSTYLQLALGAGGKKSHLLNRIERIMKTKKPTGNTRQLLTAILLLAGCLCSIAWFNPKAAHANTPSVRKVATKIHLLNDAKKSLPALIPAAARISTKDDTNKNIGITDTTKKHHHKSTVTIIDKDGKQKVYDSDMDSTAFDSISGFSSKSEWRSAMEAMRQQRNELRKQFNSPEWRAQMDAMRKQSAEIRKQFTGAAWHAQMLAMRRQSEEMKKHFDSPEWKAQMEAIKKAGEDMKKQFDSPEWKAQMEAMKLQREEMKKQFDSPEWKAQMETMKRAAEDMKKRYNSAEWKAQMEMIEKQGEEMKKQFNSPEWKAQMDAMKKAGEEMQKKFDSPEWKAQMETLKKQSEQMNKAFKDMKWDMTDSVKSEKPAKKEKLQKH